MSASASSKKRPAEEIKDESAAKRRRLDESGKSAAAEDSDKFVPPKDWPASGDIDLAVHDLPHISSDTEWWYVNGHVNGPKGKQYSFFASFFRIVAKATADGKLTHSHSLVWAIIDPETKEYFCDPILDKSSPETLLKNFSKKESGLDERLRRAFIEVVKKGNVPLPDHLFKKECVVAMDKLDLDYCGNTFVKDKKGNYKVHCENKEKKLAFTLTLTPEKKPIRHGHDGVVKIGLKADTMFYYFIPRCSVAGELVIKGKKIKVSGSAWYDHEFGGTIKVEKPEGAGAASSSNGKEEKGAGNPAPVSYAWNWLAIQLENGVDITATTLTEFKTKQVYDNFVVVIDEDSKRHEYLDCEFKGRDTWVSSRTTNDYPCTWDIVVPEAKMKLVCKAAFQNQEFVTLISKPAFWEGRVDVSGTIDGKEVKGLGFIERHGFEAMESMDKFFKKVSKLVREEIEVTIPMKPTYDETRQLIASEEMDHYMRGFNIDVFTDTVIKPLREIVDRGGKSWRSFAFLLCIDCVGGFSPTYKHWLAMPELMHVGSLIIDDIQDKSDTRRGGPTAHIKYGDAIAINAGNAAYFLSMHIIQDVTGRNLTEAQRIKMYELYFITLRAGHAGQAFDIKGLDYMMDQAVAHGDEKKALEEAVTCTHRLKSAVPAGNLARMGAVIGDGTPEQVERLGLYFESIGVAFQIIDDVLNLRGFEGNSKTRGEDIMAGKITFPVAVGMNLLKKQAERKHVWDVIQSKPQDHKVVGDVVDVLEKAGAVDRSVKIAEDMVEKAWQDLDKVIPDSFYKLLLRAFGWYVLERHY